MAYLDKAKQAACSKRHYQKNKKLLCDRAAAWTAKQRKKLKQFVDDLKRAPCTDCKQSYPPCVMDFDHVRGKKRANVAQLVGGGVSMARLMDEVDKCELVCANCHRIRTFRRR